MRNANSYQGENERQWKEQSEQGDIRHVLAKTCN